METAPPWGAAAPIPGQMQIPHAVGGIALIRCVTAAQRPHNARGTAQLPSARAPHLGCLTNARLFSRADHPTPSARPWRSTRSIKKKPVALASSFFRCSEAPHQSTLTYPLCLTYFPHESWLRLKDDMAACSCFRNVEDLKGGRGATGRGEVRQDQLTPLSPNLMPGRP